MERLTYEGAGSAVVSATAPTYGVERLWTPTYYTGATSTLRSGVERSGVVTDTITFSGAGIAVYDITDKLSPARTPDVVEVTASVDGIPKEAHGFATGDDFDRSGSLDGQLVLQKLLQASTTEDEEYLEDMLMYGWNFSTLIRWIEQIDGYVTDLRTPVSDAIGAHYVTLTDATSFGANLTTGDGKAYLTIPPQLNSLTLRSVYGGLSTASSSGVINVQVANVTDGYDFLTTKLTFDVSELTTGSAAIPAVIDTSASRNVVSTGDLIRLDVDAAGTNARNLQVTLGFS